MSIFIPVIFIPVPVITVIDIDMKQGRVGPEPRIGRSPNREKLSSSVGAPISRQHKGCKAKLQTYKAYVEREKSTTYSPPNSETYSPN